MAYKRDTKRVPLLTGSMNLTARGDSIPEQDSSIIQDFAYDQQGNLRARGGSTVAGHASGSVDQIVSANGFRYAAAGGSLDRGFGSSVGATAGRQSIASYQKYVWTIGDAHKDNGSKYWRWIPKAPTKKPTVKPQDANTTLLSAFAAAWVTDPSETGTTFGAGGPSGTYLQVGMTAGNGYSVTLDPAAFDLSTFHPNDLHRLWIWFKNSINVGAFTVQVDVNDGSFTQDYYWAILPRGNFRNRNKEWQEFQIRMAQNQTDPTDTTPFFQRVGTTANKDWGTVAALQIVFSALDDTRIRFGKWDVVGSTDGSELPEGNGFRWYYTYTTDDGHESNPSPISDPLNLTRQPAKLTDIDVSGDDQVTGINIYRTGDVLQAVYRVNGDKQPQTDYIDNNGNTQIATDPGIILENDNDDPPSGATGLAGPYLGRLYAWRGARMYWTKVLRPYAFRNPDGEDGAWSDVGNTTGDDIQAMIPHTKSMWIYKKRSIWILYGDAELSGGEVDLVIDNFGIPNPNCVYPGAGGDWIIANDGVYFFNGASATKYSDKVDKIFKGQGFTSASGVVLTGIDKTKAAIGYTGDQVLASYGGGTLVLNLSSGNWVHDSRKFTSFYYDGDFLAGQDDGTVLALSNEAGGDVLALVYEKSFNAGLPDTDKNWEDFTIDSEGGLGVEAILDFGVGGGLGFAGGGRSKLQFNGGFGDRSRSVTIALTGSGFTEVFGMWLNYWVHAREGLSFDTSPVSFGESGLKRVREIRVDIENSGSASVTLQTDNPGGALITRQVASIASGSRRMTNLVWSTDFGGYLFRWVFSAGDLRVYEMWALIELIGTFLKGAQGEFWSSDPVDADTEKIKLIKEIEVVYASNAAATLTLETDLPGNVLTIKETYTLPSTGASAVTINEEHTIKLRTHGEVLGRLIRVNVFPQGDMRIEAIRLFVKMVGAPNATEWGWYSLPVRATQDAQWAEVPLPVDVPA
jgi:hypothetical protein